MKTVLRKFSFISNRRCFVLACCLAVVLLFVGAEPTYAWGSGGKNVKEEKQGHWNITDEVLQEEPFRYAFSADAQKLLKEGSDDLDHTFLGLIDGFGYLTGLYRLRSQMANHGEDTPEENQARLEGYLGEAIQEANRCNVKKALSKLEDALHVGQDIGAHGKNHGKFTGNPDSRKDNPDGWNEAKEQTREILTGFLKGLDDKGSACMGLTACEACGGSGKCSTCGGRALVNCGQCGGTGHTACGNCNGTGLEDCAACNGNGKVECAKCGGTGKPWCAACGGVGEQICGECHAGWVHILGIGMVPCPNCNGTGFVKCTACNGTGHTPEVCGNCNGTGLEDCAACNGSGKVACTVCGGRGRTPDLCATCGGSGKTPCQDCGGTGKCPACGGAGKQKK